MPEMPSCGSQCFLEPPSTLPSLLLYIFRKAAPQHRAVPAFQMATRLQDHLHVKCMRSFDQHCTTSSCLVQLLPLTSQPHHWLHAMSSHIAFIWSDTWQRSKHASIIAELHVAAKQQQLRAHLEFQIRDAQGLYSPSCTVPSASFSRPHCAITAFSGVQQAASTPPSCLYAGSSLIYLCHAVFPFI